ncbi:MAG: type VI secretion system tube protein Hcp [Candidatus Omnitrophica bacterium]|nr:type VI secretion system tube protein Hcp [Candidatus Omnitrophota bacterium]
MTRRHLGRLPVMLVALTALWMLSETRPAAAKTADVVKNKGRQKIFMQFGDVEPFEVLSFDTGIENFVGGDDEVRGGLRSTGVRLSKGLNEYSALFAQSAAIVNTSFPELTMSIRKDSGVVPLTIHLSNVVISNYSVGSDNGSGEPVESMVLNFREMILSYTGQAPDGGDVVLKIVCSGPDRCVLVE